MPTVSDNSYVNTLTSPESTCVSTLLPASKLGILEKIVSFFYCVTAANVAVQYSFCHSSSSAHKITRCTVIGWSHQAAWLYFQSYIAPIKVLNKQIHNLQPYEVELSPHSCILQETSSK